jgi:DnaJ-class molecular chaperone
MLAEHLDTFHNMETGGFPSVLADFESALDGFDKDVAAAKAELQMRPCTCTRCKTCRGSGRVRGESWSDEMDQSDPCSNCSGSGILEDCDRCLELRALD